MRDQIDAMLRMMQGGTPAPTHRLSAPSVLGDEEIIEGVFDGENMVGPDGKSYPVPQNYASKSKLVEGDMMKLTITKQGQLVYKQIGPTPRQHVRGELVFDPTTQKWSAFAGGRMYRILTASVTFHKGRSGDSIMLLIPENGESQWGAVEAIIR